MLKDELEVKKKEEECLAPGGSKDRGESKELKNHEVSGDLDDSSTCSTPTFMDTYSKPQVRYLLDLRLCIFKPLF